MASKTPSREEVERKIEDECAAMCALMLGYNELAKVATVLGEKLYWRLMSQQAREKFIELGGEVGLTEGRTILTLGKMPYVKIYDTDIELMRAAVAQWDKEHTDGK